MPNDDGNAELQPVVVVIDGADKGAMENITENVPSEIVQDVNKPDVLETKNDVRRIRVAELINALNVLENNFEADSETSSTVTVLSEHKNLAEDVVKFQEQHLRESIKPDGLTSSQLTTTQETESIKIPEIKLNESSPIAEILHESVMVTSTMKKVAVRFDDKGNSIDDEHEVGKNCQEHDLSKEAETTKKMKKSKQNAEVNSNKTKKVAVRFDSKGDSIDDDHKGGNCEDREMSNEGESTKKHKKLKGDEDTIDSKNESSDDRNESSDHESEEDDGIPVITIPLGEILRKYARQLRGDNSKYEYEYEDDNNFVIKGFTDNFKKIEQQNSREL